MNTHPQPIETPAIPPRGFTLDEFERRTENVQRLMTAERLDALLLTTEANVRYFSGFHSQFWESPTRPWYLIVPAHGKPVAVIPEIGARGMQATWIDDIRTWPSPRPADDGVSLLVQALRDLAIRHARVGATLGPESMLRMPVNDFRTLGERLVGAEFVDVVGLLHGLKSVKSEQEVAKIAHVCELTSRAFEALPGTLVAGESQIANCKRLRLDLLRRGADNSPYIVAGSGPGGYDNIIMGPSERLIAEGDVLIIDTGTLYDGYFCDFDRNFVFGEVGDAVRRAHEIVYRATDAGLAAARPGATTSDLWAAMWGILEAGGALGNDVGRLGHGLGMQLTEWPSNTADDRTPLAPGMVLTLEPGMTFAPGKQMVHEENILITEDGARLLTRRAPPEMPVIG